MKTIIKYIQTVCLGLVTVYLTTGCSALRGQTFAPDAHLVWLTDSVQRAVVKITTYDAEKKPAGIGSGFFVDQRGHLITNYHVLKGAYAAEVTTYDGHKYPVQGVLTQNKAADLIKVKVKIPQSEVHRVLVTPNVPAIAERIIVVGSPLGLDQTVSEGIVSAVRELPGIGRTFQMSAPVSQGSSGSPVINMRGKVIGVVSFISVSGQKDAALAEYKILKRLDKDSADKLFDLIYK